MATATSNGWEADADLTKTLLSGASAVTAGASNFAKLSVADGVALDQVLHQISPFDALHYVDWLNTRAQENGDPWHYDLPTGDEWERAARGADGRAFTWGDTFDWDLTYGGQTRVALSTDKQTFDRLHMRPGLYPFDRSPFGILDLTGNVREICRDRDPVSTRYLVRGGEESFFDADEFRLAGRRGAMAREFNWDFGIRLVRYRRER